MYEVKPFVSLLERRLSRTVSIISSGVGGGGGDKSSSLSEEVLLPLSASLVHLFILLRVAALLKIDSFKLRYGLTTPPLDEDIIAFPSSVEDVAPSASAVAIDSGLLSVKATASSLAAYLAGKMPDCLCGDLSPVSAALLSTTFAGLLCGADTATVEDAPSAGSSLITDAATGTIQALSSLSVEALLASGSSSSSRILN